MTLERRHEVVGAMRWKDWGGGGGKGGGVGCSYG
jgi:hypothetical protein